MVISVQLLHGSHEHIVDVHSGGCGQYEGDRLGDVFGPHAFDGLVDGPRFVRVVLVATVFEFRFHEARADTLENETAQVSEMNEVLFPDERDSLCF